MAPDAKLAFNDLAGTSSGGIYTPQDLATGYYNYAYEVGARVHSDSWGSSGTSYDYLAAQVDLFTWQHQVGPSLLALLLRLVNVTSIPLNSTLLVHRACVGQI